MHFIFKDTYYLLLSILGFKCNLYLYMFPGKVPKVDHLLIYCNLQMHYSHVRDAILNVNVLSFGSCHVTVYAIT